MFQTGVSPQEFDSSSSFWQDQVRHYWKFIGVGQNDIRNVMDMNAHFGGFAAALSTYPVWVMNVVPVSMLNTLSAVYDRGLTGVFHDW